MALHYARRTRRRPDRQALDLERDTPTVTFGLSGAEAASALRFGTEAP
jgi:hypothetical protein